MIDKRVLPLTIGGLGIGTAEFAIMGLLPEIATSYGISIPQAGHFISAYALGVVIGAPLLIGYSVKHSPKKILIGLILLFAFFNGLCAIAPNYSFMLLTRFLSGLPHGAFFGVGTVVASRLGGKGKEARYIALMFTGLTVANLVMVPLVTHLGHTFSWRWNFGLVSLIGLIALLFLYEYLPDMDGRKEGINISHELAFLKQKESRNVLLICAIGFGGLFAWFSYISPLMTNEAGFDKAHMTFIMVLAGAGMVVGNLLGGYLSDRMGAAKTTALLLFLMMVALTGVFFLSSYKPVALALTFICGGLSMSVSAPINIMLMKAAPDSQMMAAAFMQAAFNIANALGAFLGGIPLHFALPYTYPSLVGVGMTLIGLIICLTYIKRHNHKWQVQH